jgi:hypothetical protein
MPLGMAVTCVFFSDSTRESRFAAVIDAVTQKILDLESKKSMGA